MLMDNKSSIYSPVKDMSSGTSTKPVEKMRSECVNLDLRRQIAISYADDIQNI